LSNVTVDNTCLTSRTDLSRFLNPRAIAVVGVSSDAARTAGRRFPADDFGYTGKIYGELRDGSRD
jgi:hypothetical protein